VGQGAIGARAKMGILPIFYPCPIDILLGNRYNSKAFFDNTAMLYCQVKLNNVFLLTSGNHPSVNHVAERT
jgi:hypothetical protein